MKLAPTQRLLRENLLVKRLLVYVPLFWLGLSTALPAQSDAPTEPASFLETNRDHLVRFPTKPKSPLGWTLVIRTSPHRTADVMRIEMEFATTGGPTTADQTIVARLTPLSSGHSPPQSASIISLPISIPEGTQTLRFSRHVPKTSYGNFYEVRLFQEGRGIPDCKANIGASIAYQESSLYSDQFEQSRWSLLWVNNEQDQAQRSQSIEHLFLTKDGNPFFSATTPQKWKQQIDETNVNEASFHVRTVDMKDLPQNWLSYRPFDTVVLHQSDWILLQQQSPQPQQESPQPQQESPQLQQKSPQLDQQSLQENITTASKAIRHWINAGGVVVVRGGSVADPSKVVAAAQASEISSIPSAESVDVAQSAIRETIARFNEFKIPDNAKFTAEIAYMNFDEEQIRDWKEWFPKGADILTDSLDAFPKERVLGKSGVRSEPRLAGLVIHLGKQSPDKPVEVLQWTATDTLMGWKRHRLIRHGVEPILGSSRFFQWVIPGVAQPPVYTFMGLLGIFVVLVGPVAYRKTTKSGRSYLMFAIAPILAIFTTLAMLAYGVVADGFGTTTRIRQVTWVDGQTGSAITRTRSTYFAGIRPAEGLIFPGDSDVTLYPDNQQRSWEMRMEDRFQPQGEIIVTDETIQFDRNFLPSRQQRQFVSVRPVEQWGKFAVSTSDSSESENSESSNELVIQSETGRAVDEIIVCDNNGEYFYADHIDANASVTAKRLTDKEASELLGDIFKRQWLVSSIVDRRQRQSSALRNYTNETFDLLSEQVNNMESVAKPTDGTFEFELQTRMQLGSKLPPNSFLCLTDLSPDAITVKDAVPTDSIHFVMGTLK